VNKDTFLHLLQPTTFISASDTTALEEVVQTYPYCQLAHFLVAKAQQHQESSQVSEKVKKAAVYAVNRNVLKKLLLIKPTVTAPKNSASVENTPQPTYPDAPEISEVAEKIAEPELTIERSEVSLLEQESVQPTVQSEERQPAESETAVNPNDSQKTEEPVTINIRRIDKTQQSELIDSFIKNEPRISSLQKGSKQQPESAQDLSEKSIMLPSGVISENLAGIMIKQGKTDKAIDIYEKLILKYPQKKAYFAEKIENLKNK
jgi:hypothetical protein